MTIEKRKTVDTTDEYVALRLKIVDAMVSHQLRRGEYRVMLALLILTCENYKLQGEIPIKMLVEKMHLSYSQVLRILQDLEHQKMVIIKRTKGMVSVIRIEKDPEKWVLAGKFLRNLKNDQNRNKKYREKSLKQIEEDLRG